jgi:hypothetical protein
MNQATPDLDAFDDWIAHYVAAATPEQRRVLLPIDQMLAEVPANQLLEHLSVQERLAGIPAEQRLAGIPADQLVTRLSPEERILSLPDDALRGFSPDYVATLPAHVRDAIRARVGR